MRKYNGILIKCYRFYRLRKFSTEIKIRVYVIYSDNIIIQTQNYTLNRKLINCTDFSQVILINVCTLMNYNSTNVDLCIRIK